MGLGQVHGAGPLALDHLGQIGLFDFVIGMHQHGRIGALRQARIHGKGEVGRAQILIHDDVEGRGQPLPAIGRIGRKAHPASLDILIPCLLEALWSSDNAVIAEGAALGVPDHIGRLNNLARKFCAFGQDGIDQILGSFLVTGQCV